MRHSLATVILFALFSSLLFNSCTEEDDTTLEDTATIIESDNWFESELSANQVEWFKIEGDELTTTMNVEWAELDNHGESRNYTADIKVSAYMLDGITPYFENKTNGYADKVKTITLAGGEKSALLKVELNDGTVPGTYAIRFSPINDNSNIDFIKIDIGSEWVTGEIEDGETIGYTVDCKGASRVKVMWAEEGSTETGYTAEIQGSVFHKDGLTPYKDVNNGKEIVNKNKSTSDDPKIVDVDQDEGKIKVVIQVNSKPGTFAIKVEEVNS